MQIHFEYGMTRPEGFLTCCAKSLRNPWELDFVFIITYNVRQLIAEKSYLNGQMLYERVRVLIQNSTERNYSDIFFQNNAILNYTQK